MSKPATQPPATPEEINAAYAAVGGYRFEFEQIRKIGQALAALQEQWQTRHVEPMDHVKLGHLTGSLEILRKAIADSRDAATKQ